MGKPDYLLPAICMVFCLMYTDVYSQPVIVKANVGESTLLTCGFSSLSWFRNGTKLTESAKVKPSGSTLHLLCVELSDNGMYECRDESDMSRSTTFSLIVNNPGNRQLFHIYNKDQNRCLSVFAFFASISLHLEDCNLDNCGQKWMWTENMELLNTRYLKNPKCISAQSGELLNLYDCSSNVSLNWECSDDLLKVKGRDLYLNYNNSKNFPILFNKTGVWSRWLKYKTQDNLCSDNRKAVVTPAHVVISDGESVKVTCQEINFFNPTYTWLKNGKTVSGSSSLAIHVHSNVLFLPFAYIQSSGNYTCVVKDQWGTATASTVIEIYEDPSVIHNTLNHSALYGKDICLTCQMFTQNTSYVITWYKDGVPVSLGDPNFEITTKSQGLFKKFSTELCINSLDVDDAGKYCCEIMYSTKRASAQGNVLVLVKPKVFISKLEGDLLVCNASGFPPPRLTLYKDNEHILESNNQESLTIKETAGNFTCVASNLAGTSSDSFLSTLSADIKESETSVTSIIVGCIIGGVLLAILVILIVCCYRRRKKETLNNNSDGVYHAVRYMDTRGQSSSPSEYTTVDAVPPHKSRIEFHPRNSSECGSKHSDSKAKYQALKPRAKGEWEVPSDCVKLNKKLGEGQFGQVWKGDILSRKGSRTIAVKMLHDKASAKDRKALIDELEFMKTMSPHPNIVGLVGCCTRSETVMIIVEFVPGGNLKDYLLCSRGNNKETYANLAPYSATLTSNDLLTFAYQIARGMSYLEQIKCVHRDLAARNILVGDDKTCKIADFGLARDIYRENYYRKTNGGRLPLRWMAYESIFNGITTSQSDAWSFGVVLWEIVTLGGNPYPDMNRDQVIDGLQRGYRMPKPGHCSDDIYEVMWECWQQNPDKRPTFAELTATFLRLISSQQSFLNMDNFGQDDYVNVGSYEETGED